MKKQDLIVQKEMIQRLVRYKNILLKFKSMGLSRVFSDNLGDAAGVSSSLVRKDFSLAHLAVGNKRGGYPIDVLLQRLDAILGTNILQRIIIVGCGKIGTALMNYSGFLREGIEVAAGFDSDPAKIHPTAAIPVHDVRELPSFLAGQPVEVAVLTLPETATPQAAEVLMAHGVKGILNFAPVNLRSTDQCAIQNINLAIELENLFYFIRFTEKQSRGSRSKSA